MILNERDSRHEQVLQVAQQMMTAARTAPKGKGVDIIEVAMVTESNIRILSDTMKQMYEDNGFKFFLRDADNILQAECVVLIGARFRRGWIVDIADMSIAETAKRECPVPSIV